MNARSEFDIEPDFSFEELEDLLKMVINLYGYNFSQYSKASLKRRIVRILIKKSMSFYELKQTLINDPHFIEEFVLEITVNVTEMFRDPSFYKSVRKNVLPYLASWTHVKIWNAGCSTGEEVYSFAIMLQEEGIYHKSFIYGTDINHKVLEKARKGRYESKLIKLYEENYNNSGGKKKLRDYYALKDNNAEFITDLRRNVLFAVHNLVSDGVFNEFQVVVCRNVLIYFENDLQQEVLQLFYNSLSPLGFLCLGSKENIRFSPLRDKFKTVDLHENIYQKIA